MPANIPAPDTRTAPLWRSAGAFITTLFNLFGAPQDLAADHTLTTKTHALILSWLRVAEAFLRHLLLIEASALDCSNCGPPASSRHRARERKRLEFLAHEPEAWRVSFRCFSSSPRAGEVPSEVRGRGTSPPNAKSASTPPGRSPSASRRCSASTTTPPPTRVGSPTASAHCRASSPACFKHPTISNTASTKTHARKLGAHITPLKHDSS